jgi:hypothetical protein
MFGPWYHSPATFTSGFANAKPFPHVVIDNFFSDKAATELADMFPALDDTWYRYWNPLEKKYAKNTFDGLPAYNRLFATLQSDEFVMRMRELTGIAGLEADPHLHGAGVHYHPRGGKLDMHLDYSIHPKSGKERRINIIMYLNRDWSADYGGDLQLWDSAFTQCEARIAPVFNRAVVFQTSDISYHGIPAPITCPEGEGRKSIAIYYVAEPRPDAAPRYKAQYRPLPDQPVSEGLARLYELRVSKLLTDDVLREVYPNWEKEGQGYW